MSAISRHSMLKSFSRLTILSLIILLILSSMHAVDSGSINVANLFISRSLKSFSLTDPHYPCPPILYFPPRLVALLEIGNSRIAVRAMARVYCLGGDIETARSMWEQAYDRAPHDPMVAFHLAIISFALHRPVHTRYNYEISIYAVRRGRLLQTQKDMKVAQSWYEFALNLYPNIAAASHLAGIYRAHKKFDKARAVWDDVIARLPTDTLDYWRAVAQRADLDKDWVMAAKSYERAAALADPSLAYTLYLAAGDRWMQAEIYDKAERAYHRALALQPNRMNTYLRLGHLARSQKAYDKALEWYRKAQNIAPTNYLPFYYIGITFYKQGRYEESLHYLNIALRKKPTAAWVWYYKALVLDALNRRGDALAALSKAIAYHSKPPKGWLDLQAHWQKYPDKKRDPEYWWECGRQQEQKRLWSTALGFYHYGAQVAKPPDDYRLLLREALMWRYLKQPDRAEPIYRDLVTRYPDRMDAYIGLGDLARERHAWEEALDWYKKAWQAAPDHYAPPYYLGLTAYYAGRYQEALEYLERSLERNPKAPWTWYFKALTLKALARDDKAISALEKAISLYNISLLNNSVTPLHIMDIIP